MKSDTAGYYGSRCGRRFTELRLVPAVLLGSCLLASASFAQQSEEFDFSGSLELGLEHNSNVNVSELESAAGTSDTARMLDAGLNMAWRPSQEMRAEAGYNYSSRRYQDAKDFNLAMHLLFADVSYDFELATVGANYYHADAKLGGSSFLTLGQYSVYAGRLLSEQWYLRGALNFADKDFDQFAGRDADNKGVSLDAFWFFNEGISSLMFGYSREDEDARAAEFDYQANSLRARYSHRFSLLDRDARFQLGARYQDRDYDNPTPSIGVRRDDSQFVMDTRLELSVTEYFAVLGRLERINYSSNLPSADYTDNRASLAVAFSF